jgi:hypothetical protein
MAYFLRAIYPEMLMICTEGNLNLLSELRQQNDQVELASDSRAAVYRKVLGKVGIERDAKWCP